MSTTRTRNDNLKSKRPIKRKKRLFRVNYPPTSDTHIPRGDPDNCEYPADEPITISNCRLVFGGYVQGRMGG